MASAVAGEHMPYFVKGGADELARRLFAHGAHFDEWPGGVTNLPTVIVGNATEMRLAGAINELGVIQCRLVLGGEPWSDRRHNGMDDGELLITSDHGNVEQLIDPETGEPHTAHTTNPVPLFWVRREAQSCSVQDGGLSDLAPSLCELLELEPAAEMTGRSLLRCEPPSSNS